MTHDENTRKMFDQAIAALTYLRDNADAAQFLSDFSLNEDAIGLPLINSFYPSLPSDGLDYLSIISEAFFGEDKKSRSENYAFVRGSESPDKDMYVSCPND